MDDRGTLHCFLGMQILRSEDKITVDQEKYIESVLGQFNMSDCKPMATPEVGQNQPEVGQKQPEVGQKL